MSRRLEQQEVSEVWERIVEPDAETLEPLSDPLPDLAGGATRLDPEVLLQDVDDRKVGNGCGVRGTAALQERHRISGEHLAELVHEARLSEDALSDNGGGLSWP